MKWSEIKEKNPDKFILLGNIIEEKISDTKYKIVEGTVLKISDNALEIRNAYLEYKKKGIEVIYTLPSTPKEFIIENVPIMSLLK